MQRIGWTRAGVALALTATVCGVTAASSTARPAVPGLRLITVMHRIDVIRYAKSRITWIQPGIYVASSAGAWEVDAYRRAGGPQVWQVTRSGSVVHRVRVVHPIGKLRMTNGLPNFFTVTLTTPAGTRLATSREPFCPDGYLQARVSPDGPAQPTYPQECGTPRTRVGLWGLDAGWGEELAFGIDTRAVPDGTYLLNIAIAARYARQFGIPARQRSATIRAKLTTYQPPPPPAGTARSRPARPAGTRAVYSNNPLAGPGGVPNLQALPAHDLRITHTRKGLDVLSFGATIWNSGSGPLVLDGFRHSAAPVMAATQSILRNGRVVATHRAGQFEFDTRHGHDHWHMEQIARYDLLSADGSRVIRSRKQSFCLAPTDPINLTLPGADWQPDQSQLWSACQGQDAIWIREVLPAGWGDTYYQNVAGQAFNITDVPNGVYKLRITADPPHELAETSYRDNVSILRIRLTGTPGHRQVVIL